jgi:hypothetical protein
VSVLAVFAVVACGDGDGSPTEFVGSADAITAAIAWQADEQEPVVDDDGEPQLPVIFVVADDGATIDVGVQADVAAQSVDWATVRFADDVTDTFDPDLDGEPVRDDGVLLVIGPMPDPARSVELDLVRYTSVDGAEAFTLEVTAEVHTATDGTTTRSAVVTAVTQP